MRLLAIFLASIMGYCYGLALIYQQEQAHTKHTYVIQFIRLASICALALVSSYLLHLRQIDFILLSIGFITAFWIALTKNIVCS